MSADGISIPEIFAVDDVVAANAGRIDFVPSPITAIDDKGITEYLTSIDLGYQDPDASFNALLYQVSQGTEGLKSGLFCTPQRYPGPSTSYTFRNGTTAVHDNYAYANRDFSNVVNGSSFYAKFCNASNKGSADSGSGANRGRDISELDLEKRQTGGLKPFVQSSDKSFTGYLFIGAKNTELARTAVIVLNEFSFTDTSQIRGLLTQFLDSCREQAVDHLVLDLSSNPGGSIILAYEFMRALFPTISPYFLRNYRAQPQFDVLGSYITNATLKALATTNGNRSETKDVKGMSIYDATAFLDRDGNLFRSWDDLFGPVSRHNDEFTHLFTWDITDVAFTSDHANDESFPITGYGDSAPAPPQPFKPENIVILSNGMCQSSCTSLSHVLKWQGKVKSIVLGGRPRNGPMPNIGGVYGATVTYFSTLFATLTSLLSRDLPEAAYAAAHATKLETIIRLGDYMINRSADPSSDEVYGVNLANSIFGSEATLSSTFTNDEFMPLQYIYEAADCRLWFTQSMVQDQSAQWIAAANQAFGFNGTEPWSGCVEGSFGHKTSLSGDKKLYNDGKPNNVTGFNPPNEGNQPVDLAALGLETAGTSASATQTGEASATSPAPIGTMTASGAVKRMPSMNFSTLVLGLVGLWCLL